MHKLAGVPMQRSLRGRLRRRPGGFPSPARAGCLANESCRPRQPPRHRCESAPARPGEELARPPLGKYRGERWRTRPAHTHALLYSLRIAGSHDPRAAMCSITSER